MQCIRCQSSDIAPLPAYAGLTFVVGAAAAIVALFFGRDDAFAPLFGATGFAGSFVSVTLPPLGAGLAWSNQLALSGAIQVVSKPPLAFSSVLNSGGSLVVSGAGGQANAPYWVLTTTNVTQPLTNWTHLVTNQFDGFGNFAFTASINPATPQRFYRLALP